MGERSPLEGQIVNAVRRIIRAVDLRSRQLVGRFGLTGPQLMALRAASELNSATAGAIARELQLSQATVTGILHRLEGRGLLRRLRSGSDRRTVVVTVTEEGEALLRQAPPLLQDGFRRELARLEEWEQTMVLATLQRIANMMHADEIDESSLVSTEGLRTAEPAERMPDVLGECLPDAEGVCETGSDMHTEEL